MRRRKRVPVRRAFGCCAEGNRRLSGQFCAAGELVEGRPEYVGGLIERLETWEEEAALNSFDRLAAYAKFLGGPISIEASLFPVSSERVANAGAALSRNVRLIFCGHLQGFARTRLSRLGHKCIDRANICV